MKIKNFRYFSILTVVPLVFLSANRDPDEHPVLSFLNSLSEDQKEMAMMPFDDESRESWHYLPQTTWPRQGIQIHDLNDRQRELLHRLLRSYLSETGYGKTEKIIELENVLATIEGNPSYRDPEKYSVAFYGDPRTDELWAWSFEGHHISLNFTINKDRIEIAPRFFGANPATIRDGERKGERALPREEDLAFELLGGLSESQLATVHFSDRTVRDIYTSNSTEFDPLVPVGIRAKELTSTQRKLLMGLVWEYLSSMPQSLAQKRLDYLNNEDPGEIRFGWAGSLTKGKPHYYRIQGKSFLIEYDNSQNNANHVHSVWRDYDGDFGRDLIREHYESAHLHHGTGPH